jgi:hypothetical protein
MRQGGKASVGSLRMARRNVLIGILCCAGAWGFERQEQSAKSYRGRTMKTFPPHPGTIKMVDVYAKTSREVPAEEVPERGRFVYLKDGIETENKSEATERVPIVEVEMLSLDEEGHLVSKEVATKVRMNEFGPQHKLLRSTTMVKH